MTKIYIDHIKRQTSDNKHEVEHQAGLNLLGRALKEAYGIEEYMVEQGDYGKPYLASHPEIFFNISHSKDLVVCAVGDCELGVDVEMIREYRESVVKRIMSPQERNWIQAVSGKRETEKRFFQLWTLKESYVKACGCGLSSVPLTDISFSVNEEEISCSREGYQFWQRIWEEDYVISLCWKGDSKAISVKSF